ncbi:MAG TPA: hypothetical protein VJ776_11435 [Thermoanaerobaculia bacterium]|nr:hypothetical protein [Thermoanaerobaculia bacterium]
MSNEGHYLKILNRPDVPPDVMEALLADRTARKYHTVRRALAAHPRTPRREALSLVSTLYWRDLAHLSADSRVHPEVRRAADRDLARRLPEMALSERVDLARSAGRGTLLLLRFDKDARVLQALLDNRLATEPDLVQVAARAETPPASLEAIAQHPRWGLRPSIRSALLRNPRLPVAVAISLLSRASASDLAGVRETPGISRLLKACAETVLARRRKAPYHSSS